MGRRGGGRKFRLVVFEEGGGGGLQWTPGLGRLQLEAGHTARAGEVLRKGER